MTTPRDLAEVLISKGFAVLPLLSDKSPVTLLVPNGFHDATGDLDRLWMFDQSDVEMVGIVPGSNDVIVLDVDIKGAVNGEEELLKLSPKGWQWCNIVNTPSGGFHIYLEKPFNAGHVGNHDLCPGVNVRCDAGYVVAPNNPGYWFESGNLGLLRGAQAAPGWVMERLQASAEAEELESPYDVPEARLEPQGEWHPKVTEAFRRFDRNGDRHGSMRDAVARLCNYELLSYPGSTYALGMLEEEFMAAVADRASPGKARDEYRRALAGGRKKVRSTVSVGLEERDKDHQFLEAVKRDHGATKEDIERIEHALAEHDPLGLKLWTMRELMGSDLTLNWLVRNVLCMPTYGQIAGEKKTLKTYIAQYLALAVATGKPFLGQFPVERAGNVVMFVGEGGRIPWTRRMARIGESVGIADIRGVPIHTSFQTAPLLSPQFKHTVERALEELNPVLTIIDPLYAFHGAEVNAASIHEEGALLTTAAAPFVEHGSTLMFVNHFNKGSDKRGLNRITMSGSGEWVDSWMLTEERGAPDLNSGTFFIRVESGSRQWGGMELDLDFNIGTQDPMGGEPDEPISFTVRRSYT